MSDLEKNNMLTVSDLPVHQSALIEIEKSRAVEEIQASLVIAKKFPRDTVRAFNSIIEACKRPSFAKMATYSYKRGNQVISDGSIRLAELMAQNYQNMDFGVREIDQKEGVSTCESFCFDKETNTRQVKVFQVHHKYKAHGEMKILTDNRDIYEYVANQGARRLRACIFGLIPFDFKEAALNQIRETLKSDFSKKPLVDVIREMVAGFKTNFQVSQEMLEKYLGHPVAETNLEEVADLQGIFNSLKDKHTKRSDWFESGDSSEEAPAPGSLKEKLRNKTQTAKAAEEPKDVTPAAEPSAPPPKAEPTVVQKMAGKMKFTCIDKYKNVVLREIPEDYLNQVLNEAETKTGHTDEFRLFYSNACLWLGRKNLLQQ